MDDPNLPYGQARLDFEIRGAIYAPGREMKRFKQFLERRWKGGFFPTSNQCRYGDAGEAEIRFLGHKEPQAWQGLASCGVILPEEEEGE